MSEPAEAAAEAAQGNEGSEGTEIAPELAPASPGEAEAVAADIPWHALAAGAPQLYESFGQFDPPGTEELRACIEAVRAWGAAAAAGESDSDVEWALGRRVCSALGFPFKASPLEWTELALQLVPEGWTVRFEIVLSKDDQRAFGAGPHLPAAVTEAVLAAAISDRISAQAKDASAIGLER